jgi:hypothetical protein
MKWKHVSISGEGPMTPTWPTSTFIYSEHTVGISGRKRGRLFAEPRNGPPSPVTTRRHKDSTLYIPHHTIPAYIASQPSCLLPTLSFLPTRLYLIRSLHSKIRMGARHTNLLIRSCFVSSSPRVSMARRGSQVDWSLRG